MSRNRDAFTKKEKIKTKLRNLRPKKKGKKNKFGRDKNRTHDLSHAKGTRYQLRHTPIICSEK